MRSTDLVRTLRRGWRVLIASLLGGVAIALLATFTQAPTYSATSKLYVSAQQAANGQDLSQGGSFVTTVVQSYAQVVTTPIVLNEVNSVLRLGTTPAALARRVTASASTGTVVLEVTATDESPSLAARIANATASRLIAIVPTLSPTDTSASGSPVKVTIVQQASPPHSPISPNIPLNIVSGTLAGIALGAVILLVRERFDTRIRIEADLVQLTNHAILGRIPLEDSFQSTPLITRTQPLSPSAEAFRIVRTNLEFVQAETASTPNQARVFTITSAGPGEGKSTTALNLASVLADAGQATCVVDADLRRPKVASYAGLDEKVGLTNVLAQGMDLSNALQTLGTGGTAFSILPAGSRPPNPSELLSSTAFSKLLDELRTRYSYVLIDAPPVTVVTDASIAAAQSDGTIVVCAASRTTRASLLNAVSALNQVRARIAGIVLNYAKTRGPDKEAYAAYDYGTNDSR